MRLSSFAAALRQWPLWATILFCLAANVAPNAAAAEPSAPILLQDLGGKTPVQWFEHRGFSTKFAQEIDLILNDNRERIARGDLPNEAQNIFSFEEVKPITDADGMRIFVNDGRLIEREDERKLGLPPILDESTYAETLDKLFDPVSRKRWLRSANGAELTVKALARDSERLMYSKSDYVNRLAEMKKSSNGEEIISIFFFLYNEGKKDITYPSIESYRRLLMAS